MRLWGGRFAEANDPRVAEFTRSVDLDRELALDDLAGSVAHVRGLGRAGLLTADEVDSIVAGLDALRPRTSRRTAGLGSGARGRPPEPRGRPRRTDRAGRRASSTPVVRATTRSRRTCGSGRGAPATGSTRRSSPSSGRSSGSPSARARPSCPARPTSSRPSRCSSPITCWPTWRCSSVTARGSRTLAVDSTSRPLGAGALAGAGYPLDREATARELGFAGVTANSLDAVYDRDFVVEVLAAIALGMVHLSRLAEEITWWSNPRFGFVRVADAFSTGSSMMPNKRNPDPAELVRGRAARVIGQLAGIARPPEGPPAGLSARPPGGQGPAVRGGGDVRGVARGDGGPGGDAGRRRGRGWRGGRRGVHDRHRRGRRPGSAGRPVQGRASRRGCPGGPRRGGRDRPRRARRRGDRRRR